MLAAGLRISRYNTVSGCSKTVSSISGFFSQRFFQTSGKVNMPIKAGEKLPEVDLFDGAPDKKVNTSELKKGKVAIFGVPGAFTPTCHKDHAPLFVNAADNLKAKGINKVVCVACNDPFVMDAWAQAIDKNKKIQFLADTNAVFAKALDVDLDLTAVLGNVRCKRFSMLVVDGVVKGIDVEPDGTGLTCSRPDNVLKYA